MSPRDAAVVVFAREPAVGRGKTRLAAEIGAEEACRVYRHLLVIALRAARGVVARRFAYVPPGDRLDPRALPLDGFAVRTQAGADLGARMDAAFRALFAEGLGRVVLIGSDCPAVDGALLRRALAALADHDTVFAPTRDGGYFLVGQRAPARDLFSGIPWSTAAVWPLTRERLAARGWSAATLPVLEDIDDAAALRRWRAAGGPPLGRSADRSRP